VGIVSLLRHLLPDKRKERLSRIRDLPEARRTEELGAVYYEACFDHAMRFVQEQIARGEDSPFHGAVQERFLQEMLALEFWVLRKVLGDAQGGLMERVYGLYCRAFHGPQGGGNAAPQWIADRLSTYTNMWKADTGLDEAFGRRVAEHIFNSCEGFSARETCFWIVEHAREAMDDLRELAELWRSMNTAGPEPRR
jgi:hypothetical protein